MRGIPLTRGFVALVDDDDVPIVAGRSWCARTDPKSGHTYAVSAGGVQMHRLILGAQDGVQVDHIDCNSLNNCRPNLRTCTPSQNLANSRSHRDSLSSYKGVSWWRGKWRAQISSHRVKIHLGGFADEESAARAYDNAALHLFGEFARLNFPIAGTCGARR